MNSIKKKRQFLDTVVCTYHHNINNSLAKIKGSVDKLKLNEDTEYSKEVTKIEKGIYEIKVFLEKLESEKNINEEAYSSEISMLLLED